MANDCAAQSGSESRRELLRLLGRALVTFLLWRGSLYLFDLIGLSLIPNLGKCRDNWQVFGQAHPFWNGFFRWDSGWYLAIAERGYSFHPDSTSSVAFYPLLPYLSRYLGRIFGGTPIAALVIANVAAVGAIFYLRRLGSLLFGPVVGQRSVLLLLVFPTSLFLSAFYTESLFTCLAAASMFHYFRGSYLLCGALGFLAGLTRATGLVLFAALALDLCWRLYRREDQVHWRMLGLALIPLGLGAFMWILQYQVGDPLAFSKTQAHWNRHASWPWQPLLDAFAGTDYTFQPNFSRTQRFIDAAHALAFLIVAGIMAFTRERVALWAFVLLGVLLPLTTYNLGSMNRYMLGLFPAFFAFAKWLEGHAELERWLFFSFAFFLAIYSLRFMQCGWAG